MNANSLPPHPAPPPPRVFFVVGYPRSGTTLLQQMLGAHPDIAMTPETSFMRRYWRVRDFFGPLDHEESFARLLADIVSAPSFRLMALDADAYIRAARERPRTYGTLFRLLIEQFAASRGVAVVGEKTPKHLLYLPQLRQFFPEAQFVHIVRDPRAAVNSLQKLEWAEGDLSHNAAVWTRELAVARRARVQYGSGFMTVRYESLVRSPDPSLRAVCAFLRLPFDPAMLAYHRTLPTTVDVAEEPWKRNALRPPDPSAIDRWRSELSSPDVAAVEAETYFEMRRWGYTPETDGLAVRAARRAGARVARRAGAAARHRTRSVLARLPFLRQRLLWPPETWFDDSAERRPSPDS